MPPKNFVKTFLTNQAILEHIFHILRCPICQDILWFALEDTSIPYSLVD